MKKLKHSLLIIFLVLSATVFAQNPYEKAEGVYKVSDMARSSFLYLLKDSTFLYSHFSGGYSLEFWGNYKLKNKQLIFQPDTYFMNEFEAYGTNNKSDSLKVYVSELNRQHLKIKVEGNTLTKSKKQLFFSEITLPKKKHITLTYNSQQNPKEKKLTIKLLKNTDEVKIFYYNKAKSIKQMVLNQPNSLINDEYKRRKKQKISKKKIKEIQQFIRQKRAFTSFKRDGKVYVKLSITE